MSRASIFKTNEERVLTGGGGRGPQPPQPFGGGGGGGRGDGDDTPGHSERLRRYRMGLYFAIGSILMLFVSFTTLFVARRQAGRFDPFTGTFMTDWVSTPLPLQLLLINTALLLVSTFTVEMARRSAVLETILIPITSIPGVAQIPQRSLMWVRITTMLGLGFLAGQSIVWQQLHMIASRLDNPLSSSFVVMLTGGHAIHLLGGILALVYLASSRRLKKSFNSRRIAIDIVAWYWHFMGAMWIYVLVVLFFIH